MEDEEVTVAEAVEILKVSRGRVHQLIKSGVLSARDKGVQKLLKRAEVEARAASHPGAGRPKEPIPVVVPLVGSVGAGPGRDEPYRPGAYVTGFDIPADHEVVAYRVVGDSMTASDIHDGDYILVRQKPAAKSTDIVVAWVQDQGMMVKHITTMKGRSMLHSGEKGHRGWTHEIGDGDHVYGVYIGKAVASA